jgi:AraC-like DNA-binding protein
MTRPTYSPILPDRLHNLTVELLRYAPESGDRLARAKTEREFLEVVCELFNLTSALTPDHYSLLHSEGLSKQITAFISSNLHKGLTLKLLAQFLGYSEKCCSDFFQSTMGESFSSNLKRRRTDMAASLLTTTDKSVAEIADALGFSDQFSFSHFFKRSTGQSPREFRTDRGQRRPLQTSTLPSRGKRRPTPLSEMRRSPSSRYHVRVHPYSPATVMAQMAYET